jgi:thymidylate synthase ThyX
MKVTIDIDCTPEEARTFLGLPDVKTMQDEMMREMTEKLRTAMNAIGPEEAMRMWLPASMQAAEQFQKMFAQFYGMKKD